MREGLGVVPAVRAAALSRRTKSKRRAEALKTVMRSAQLYDIPRASGVSTLDTLQECLERVVAIMRFAAQQGDNLKADDLWVEFVDRQGNTLVEPNQWMALEGAMRAEAIELSVAMENLGIEERRTQVAEQMAGVIAPVLKDVLDGLDLSAAQKRKVPGIVRARLELLEGGRAA